MPTGKSNFWDKIGCFFGSHDFSSWKFGAANSCVQLRTCSKCGKTEQKQTHGWGDWHYRYQNSCQLERTCRRCSEAEIKEGEHAYGGWVYAVPGSCEIRRTCSRCGAYLYKTEHQWGDWEFRGPNTCEQVLACRRCGERQVRSVPHAWSEWKYESPTSCGLMRHCIRCYAGETKPPEHQWTGWEVYSSTEDSRICLHCKKIETRYRASSSYGNSNYKNNDVMDNMRRNMDMANDIKRRSAENMSRYADIIRRMNNDDDQ